MTMSHNIIFRCDASNTIGFGHAIRSFALSEEFSARGYSPHFVVTPPTVELLASLGANRDVIHSIDAAPGSHEDLSATARIARELNATWFILDGYNFLKDYQSKLRELTQSAKLLVFDDGVINGFDCHIVLNQNLRAENSNSYKVPAETTLLLGSAYTIFRKSFRDAPPYSLRQLARNISITFGGADTHNLTATMLAGLVRSGELSNYSIRVIIGAAYIHHSSLEAIRELASHNIEIVPFTNEIIEHFMWSDLVIAAAGSVAWELALLRVPMALVVTADNQQAVAKPLAISGAALILGDVQSFDPDKAAKQVVNLMGNYSLRRQLSVSCGDLIDCHGAKRVVDVVERLGYSDLQKSVPVKLARLLL